MPTRMTRYSRSTSRPNRTWGMVSVQSNIPASTSLVLANFVPVAPVDETVLRQHLTYYGSNTEQQQPCNFAIGAIRIKQVAAATPAAFPLPFSNGDDDGWMMHQVEYGADTTRGVTGTKHVDSKSKRVFEDGDALALIIQNRSTSPVVLDFTWRVLAQVRGTR